MKVYFYILRNTKSIALFSGVVSEQYILQSEFKSHLQPLEDYSILISVFLIAILSFVFYLLYVIILNNKYARQIIEGENNIEGYWAENIKQNSTRENWIGLKKISVDDEYIDYSGMNYDLNGVKNGTYNADIVRLNYPNMSYIFSWRYAIKDDPQEGFGRVFFSGKEYSGYFFSKGEKYEINGKKISKNKYDCFKNEPLRIKDFLSNDAEK